jgi:chromosome segregation ATPase
MWQELDEPMVAFLPEVGTQEAQTAVADVRERLDKVESQLMSQYTSIAAYSQIAQRSVETARAEARADLDRERNLLISLVERAREEWHNDVSRGEGAASAISGGNADAALRLITLEERFAHINELFTECLRNQEELANSIASLLERQMRQPLHAEIAEPLQPAVEAPRSDGLSPAAVVDHVIEMMALH